MSIPASLQQVLNQHNGIITTRQANEIGISNQQLRLLVDSGDLEHAAHGVYSVPDDFEDKMYIAQIQKPKMIYSHETALFLHDLTDRDPINYTVTVPSGYNTTAINKSGIVVFTVKPELHNVGTIQLDTVFGHPVTTYGLERTLCDCIRSRNKMDIAIVTDAVKRYTRRNDKNLVLLMEMAQTFRVSKLLKAYLEVLL